MVTVYIYNLVLNIVIKLLRSVRPGSVTQVEIKSHRFSRNSLDKNVIFTRISKNDGTSWTGSIPFTFFRKRNIVHRDIAKHVPLTNEVMDAIISSTRLAVNTSIFTKYDVESGTAIINVPSNPNVDNQAFVTRNMNTLMTEHVGLHVSTL